MFNINNWKEPIYKNDVIGVLINATLATILSGIFVGLLEYLLYLINFPISFTLIILPFFIGIRIKKGYYSYHILYPTLSLIFLILSLFITRLTLNIIILGFNYGFLSLTSYTFYLMAIEPLYDIYALIKGYSNMYYFYLILDLIVYSFAFYYSYRLSSGTIYRKR